jgi:hypothetical protein
MLKPRAILAALAPIALGAPALAQTNITSANKYSWSENCGYMNWRDANGGTQGVRIRNTFMSGFIWMENVGWVNLGDGTPGGCGEYMNVTGDDFGVNIEADGSLTGLAWGENVGWINFAGGAMATPPPPGSTEPPGGCAATRGVRTSGGSTSTTPTSSSAPPSAAPTGTRTAR